MSNSVKTEGMISRSSSLPSSKLGSHKACVCGTPFIADSLFCRKCGHRRPAQEAAPRDASPNSRRQHNYIVNEAHVLRSGDRSFVPQERRGRVDSNLTDISFRSGMTSATSDSNLTEALRRKDTELSSRGDDLSKCRAELASCRSELAAAKSELSRMSEASAKQDASAKGLREQVRMWEQEALSLRGRLAAWEAEAHRERSNLEGEVSRLRLARDDARRQAQALHADCSDRLARSRAELDDASEKTKLLQKEKDDQLQRQRQELSERFEEQSKAHAKARELEAVQTRQVQEALESRNRELEHELVRVRDAKGAAEAKLKTLNETHFSAEQQSAKLLAASESQITSQREQLQERQKLVSNLASQVKDKSQALEDQELKARERHRALQQSVEKSAEKTEKQMADESHAYAQSLQAQRESLLQSEASQARALQELQTARREEANLAASVQSLKEELAKSPVASPQLPVQAREPTREAHWADSPFMPSSPVIPRTPPSCQPETTLRPPGWHNSEKQCACGSTFAADASFCAKCGRPMPSDDTTVTAVTTARSPQASPTRSPRSPQSNLWNSLRSPVMTPATTPASRSGIFARDAFSMEEELKNAGGDSKQVSFLEEQRGRAAAESADQEGAVWRRRCRELEEQLATINVEKSREEASAKEAKASLEQSRMSHREHEESKELLSSELIEVRQRLRTNSAASETSQQRSHFLEDRLERTERERDRLIEATNELRADLRATNAGADSSVLRSPTASQRREPASPGGSPSSRGVNVDKPASQALRALQHRYSNGTRAPPASQRVADRRLGRDSCACGNVFVTDATFCQMCGAHRANASPRK